MTRLRIDLAYDGTKFHGWARQPSLRTVQGELESAIDTVLRIHDPADGVHVTVAGRTDTGVHASHQVCHADIDQARLDACIGHMEVDPIVALTRRLRHKLPHDIMIHAVTSAPAGFDARFSALERVYVYRVCDDPDTFDPKLRNQVLLVDDALDVPAMNLAIAAAIGLHDFGSFATANPGGTTIRDVKYARWFRPQPIAPSDIGERVVGTQAAQPHSIPAALKDHALKDDALDGESSREVTLGEDTPREETSQWAVPRESDGAIWFQIVADAFAHNMVRCLVQACLQVGTGKRDPQWFAERVRFAKREGAIGPAPACGLTLEHVGYPADEMLAIRAQSIRARRTLP